MFVPFSSLPGSSRIWVYQASRTLTATEEQGISNALKSFCEQWSAHGQPLKSSFKIAYRYFIILCADENFQSASGCSIDGSVRILKHVQEESGIDFFDRRQVAILSGGEVQSYPQKSIKEMLSLGKLQPDDITFNNLIEKKGDLDDQWIVPLNKSWLAKLVNVTV